MLSGIGIGIRGEYMMKATKMAKSGRALNTRLVRDWFPNLITDLGMNKIPTDPFSSCVSNGYVGNGNIAPTFADTEMGGLKTSYNQPSIEVYYNPNMGVSSARQQIRFEEGQVTGIVTEVGMGWNSTSEGALFSRALIVDELGDPASVTIFSDEVLDLYYRIWLYPVSLADKEFVMNVNGVARDVIIRPAWVNNFNNGGTTGQYNRGWSCEHWNGLNNTAQQRAFTEHISTDITVGPTSAAIMGGTPCSYKEDLAYEYYSLERKWRAHWDLDNSINNTELNSLMINGGGGCWQIAFDPPLSKNNTQRLTVSGKFIYSRIP